MCTYAVGDIHGCFDEWQKIKNYIELKDKDAKFILVGDIIDRGPKTFEMLNWAMNNITEDGKYQMVLGNHEHMKIDWWEREKHYNKSIKSLSKVRTDRYNFLIEAIINNITYAQMDNIIEWFKQLPVYKDINIQGQRFIIVHAHMPFLAVESDGITIKNNLDDDTISRIVWDRNADPVRSVKDAIIVNGHNPSIFRECFPFRWKNYEYGKVIVNGNRINIDCGLVYKGAKEFKGIADLAVLKLEDLSVTYLSNIQ